MNDVIGWHEDPTDRLISRYWDGQSWSGELRWDGAAWTSGTAELDGPMGSGSSAGPSVPEASAEAPAPARKPSSVSGTTRALLVGGLASLVLLLAVVFVVEGHISSDGDRAAFCRAANEEVAGFDGTGMPTPRQIDQAQDLLDEMQATAPAEIRDEVATMSAAIDAAEQASNGDVSGVSGISSAKVDAASSRIDAYLAANCDRSGS